MITGFMWSSTARVRLNVMSIQDPAQFEWQPIVAVEHYLSCHPRKIKALLKLS